MTAVFKKQIDEIRSDRALVLYGAALAAANIATFAHWKFKVGVPLMIGRGADTLCWPFLENCQAFQLPVFVVNYGLWGYLLLSLVAGFCFVRRNVAAGYWLLVLVNLIRVLVMLQDYRLRANQHYMLNWVLLAYLFLPWKRQILHHMLVALYFWAGILKLDPDWLSGASLYSQHRLWFPTALVPAATAYVLLLETVLIWGLYSRRSWIFAAVLAQLVLFHLTSWPIVGAWYPLLMFCLLSIIPLTRVMHPRTAWAAPPARERGGRLALTAAVLALFSGLQLVPRAFPGDTAVTGEGRLFALHMFDALVECEATLTHHLTTGGRRIDVRTEPRTMSHRSRCDPLIYYSIAKNQCGHIQSGRPGGRSWLEGVVDLDLSLRSRRNSQRDYHEVVAITRFCASSPSYAIWRHNEWISVPPYPVRDVPLSVTR